MAVKFLRNNILKKVVEDFCSITNIFEEALKNKFSGTNFVNSKFYMKICELVPTSLKDSIKKVFVKDSNLFISVDSSVTKHALRLSSNSILKILNEFQNDIKLKEIVLL